MHVFYYTPDQVVMKVVLNVLLKVIFRDTKIDINKLLFTIWSCLFVVWTFAASLANLNRDVS